MITRRQALKSIGAVGAGLAVASPSIGIAQEPAKVFRIGYTANGGELVLAKASGAIEKRLADRGIAVTWSQFTSGPPLLEALGASAVDFGSTGDVPPLFAQAAGRDLVYAAVSTGSLNALAIVVDRNGPIASLSDLKGKKFSFRRGSNAHNFAVKALRKAGLTLADVTEVDLAPADAAAAFAAGHIDAWIAWDPFLAIAEKDPKARVLVTGEGLVQFYQFFEATGSFAKANPKILADVIDALKKNGDHFQQRIDETAESLSKITGWPLEVQRVALTRKGADLGRIGPLGPDALAYQQSLADEFFELKIIPRKLNVSEIVWQPK